MTNEAYKTITGGSIDYAHYIQKSHEIRSEEAHSFLQVIATKLKALYAADSRPSRPSVNIQRIAQRKYRARHFRGGEWRKLEGQTRPMDLPFNKKA